MSLTLSAAPIAFCAFVAMFESVTTPFALIGTIKKAGMSTSSLVCDSGTLV